MIKSLDRQWLYVFYVIYFPYKSMSYDITVIIVRNLPGVAVRFDATIYSLNHREPLPWECAQHIPLAPEAKPPGACVPDTSIMTLAVGPSGE